MHGSQDGHTHLIVDDTIEPASESTCMHMHSYFVSLYFCSVIPILLLHS